jgi:hypothetical protein
MGLNGQEMPVDLVVVGPSGSICGLGLLVQRMSCNGLSARSHTEIKDQLVLYG